MSLLKTEMTVSAAAANEVHKLIFEHQKEGGPFNSELLAEFQAALDEADRIVIEEEEES